jgi:chalcone isomerase-like protein
MMSPLAAGFAFLAAASPVPPPVVVEPKTGLSFPTRSGGMSLLGVGVRTRSVLKLKVYALGLYVADTALAGPLLPHKRGTQAAPFFRDLVYGDFEKKLVLTLARDLSAEQIRGTFRQYLPKADPALREQFASYFDASRAGQGCVMHWVGGRLETTVCGTAKPPIASKAFADELFAIWLGERAARDPLRRQLVSRAPDVIP